MSDVLTDSLVDLPSHNNSTFFLIRTTNDSINPVTSKTGNSTVDRIPALPSYATIDPSNFCWGKEREAITHQLNKAYNEVVHWKKNLFKIPSGKTGMVFGNEISSLLSIYADASPLESITITAIMTMPALLLQKPQPRPKNEEHVRRLKEQLELSWKKKNVGQSNCVFPKSIRKQI